MSKVIVMQIFESFKFLFVFFLFLFFYQFIGFIDF